MLNSYFFTNKNAFVSCSCFINYIYKNKMNEMKSKNNLFICNIIYFFYNFKLMYT